MRKVPVHGAITRGTTAPNRLRRVDAWIASQHAHRIRVALSPLVVDLGFGASPITTIQLADHLTVKAGLRPRVIGLDTDPARVETAQHASRPPVLAFQVGGFELAGLRPDIVRAMNVLRQYREDEVEPAWNSMTTMLAPGGVLVEGTCDEGGHVGSWVLLDRAGPVSLTLSARLATLECPSVLAQRLPKALIHRNVPGERVHDLLETLCRGWRISAAHGVFGSRERWRRAVREVRASGWPVIGSPARWRLGELTVRWNGIAPRR